jgi:hypothetical protein
MVIRALKRMDSEEVVDPGPAVPVGLVSGDVPRLGCPGPAGDVTRQHTGPGRKAQCRGTWTWVHAIRKPGEAPRREVRGAARSRRRVRTAAVERSTLRGEGSAGKTSQACVDCLFPHTNPT